MTFYSLTYLAQQSFTNLERVLVKFGGQLQKGWAWLFQFDHSYAIIIATNGAEQLAKKPTWKMS